MEENDKCLFCDHVGITPVSNNLTTVKYPSIKKKIKIKYLAKREFGAERKAQIEINQFFYMGRPSELPLFDHLRSLFFRFMVTTITIIYATCSIKRLKG